MSHTSSDDGDATLAGGNPSQRQGEAFHLTVKISIGFYPRLSNAVKQKTCDPCCWIVGLHVMSAYLLGDVPLIDDCDIP